MEFRTFQDCANPTLHYFFHAAYETFYTINKAK